MSSDAVVSTTSKPCARCKVEPRNGKDLAYCRECRIIKTNEYKARLKLMDRAQDYTKQHLAKLADGYRPR